MTKIDELIEKFKEFKEELNKNVNMSYSASPNAVTGTSGGQGGMYRSEDMSKQMVSASPGGAQDAMQMSEKDVTWCKCDEKEGDNPKCPKHGKLKKSVEKLNMCKNGQWALDDGTNREANPKLRSKDIGPGGKIHMVKDEDPEVHNKGKFKVMEMAPEKESKKEDVKGLPYNGKDKAMHKGEKQGNEAKGFDENKAPGRGTLTV